MVKNIFQGVTPKLLFAVIVAGAGSGFQHGYTTGVVNAPKDVMVEWLKEVYEGRSGETPKKEVLTFIWSLAVSIYCIGGIIGGLLTSIFATKLGRKGGLIVNNIFALIGGLLMGYSKHMKSPEMFMGGRFFVGFNSGLNSGLCAMYLVEISPQSMRGAIGTVYQLILTMAILISQVAGSEKALGTQDLWPICFGLSAFVAIFQAVLLYLCPETPKYLYSKDEEKSKEALMWLRGKDTDSELEEIKNEYEKEMSIGRATFSQMWSQKILRTPLILSILIMLAQQFSGINAVMYYSSDTFKKAGFSTQGAQTATIAVGAMNVLMTVVSLVLVDIAGRKTLLMAGFGSMFFVTCGLTVTLSNIENVSFFSSLSVALVVLFVVAFATGPGSIPWFLVSEFFTQDARPLAASFAVSTNWLANFFVALFFLPIEGLIGANVFIIFAFLQFLFIVIIAVKIPETKNKSYDEISANFT